MTNTTGAEYACDALEAAGVGVIVGLPGTQTLPIDRVIANRENIDYVMARHETAIPHIAWGHYEVSGKPAATLTVPGPGETNAMHGLKNALEDCVPIFHFTGDANPEHFGKKPIHEIDPHTYDPVVKQNKVVRTVAELPGSIVDGIESALAPPYGPVRLGIPTGLYDREFEASEPEISPDDWTPDITPPYDSAVDLLTEATKPVLLLGGGVARSAGGPKEARKLAREFDLPVVTTYKGKGTFPEDDPRYLGAISSTLPSGAVSTLETADVVLALGSDLDGICTKNWSLPLGEDLIHVTLDPAAMDAGYPATVEIVDDVATAAETMRHRALDRSMQNRWSGEEIGQAVRDEYFEHLREEGYLDDGPPFHTPAVLQTVESAIPDDSIVITDVGGFRLWTMQTFQATEPRNFLTAGSWAGMGVGLPAAIGAKLARPDETVVCLSGDGGLLMCIHEMATAAEENMDIVLVVSNNSDYAIISQLYGDSHPGTYPPFGWASPSFVTIAEGFGWEGHAVTDAEGLNRALEEALDSNGPTLIDVDVPSDERSASQLADFDTSIQFDN